MLVLWSVIVLVGIRDLFTSVTFAYSLPLVNPRHSFTHKALWDRIAFNEANKLIVSHSEDRQSLIHLDTLLDNDQVDKRELQSDFQKFQQYYHQEQRLIPSPSTEGSIGSNSKGNRLNVHSLLSSYSNSPLARALWDTYRQEIRFTGLLRFGYTFVQFLPPLLISRLLRILEQGYSTSTSNPYLSQGLGTIGMIYAVLWAKTVLENLYFYHSMKLGLKIRSVLMYAISHKILSMDDSSRSLHPLGQILNNLQLDTLRLEQVGSSFHTLWDGIFQIIGYSILLYRELGISILSGLVVLLLCLPLNSYFLHRLSKIRSSNYEHNDNRMKLLNEIIRGAYTIRVFGWEWPFLQRFQSIRSKEIRQLKTAGLYRSLHIATLSISPALIALVALGCYSLLLGNQLSTPKVFTSLSLFNQLRFPILFFPILMNTLLDGKMSLQRIGSLLQSADREPYLSHPYSPTLAVNMSSCWFSVGNTTLLEEITVAVPQGEMVGVVGGVGAGKSSLLTAILGDSTLLRGSIAVNSNSNIYYMPQTSWLPSCKIRDAILFGLPYRPAMYSTVIQACELTTDFMRMVDGDLSKIQENGANLSGGQKQRISLARCVYAALMPNSSSEVILLLDNPLSALDPQIAKSIYHSCFNKLLKGYTRIIATSGVEILPLCDRILVMNATVSGGVNRLAVCNQGSYRELVKKGMNFHSLVNQTTVDDWCDEQRREDSTDSSEGTVIEEEESYSSENSSSVHSDRKDRPHSDGPKSTSLSSSPELQTLRKYLSLMDSKAQLLVVLFSFLAANMMQSLQLWVMGSWRNNGNGNRFQFALLGVTAVNALVAWLKSYSGYSIGAVISRKIHDNWAASLLSAPLQFYDRNTLGKLSQQSSRDLDIIDHQLPGSVSQTISSLLTIVTSLATIVTVTPSFLVILLPLALHYHQLVKRYRAIAKELKQIDISSRTPLLSQVSEMYTGLSVIRSFSNTERYLQEADKRIYNQYIAFHAGKLLDRWFGVRLDLLGNSVILFVSLLALLSKSASSTGIGISLTTAISSMSLLNWAVRNSAETAILLSSVENIYKTITIANSGLSSFAAVNPDRVGGEGKPLEEFRGSIQFRNVSMKYPAASKYSLEGINLCIADKEYIGICGRSGGGKSTILRALLRLNSIEKSSSFPAASGIFIDDIDIDHIPNEKLRKLISIVPQEPTIFSGTLRFNLDPSNSFTDEQLWEALRKVHLSDHVASLSGGLGYVVPESGEGFSLGQKQLISIARVLLTRSKIVLLDEVSSAADQTTADIIQHIIATELRHQSTVIAITHKIESILDADRIIVLENGRVLEKNTPSLLIANTKSRFSKLLKNVLS